MPNGEENGRKRHGPVTDHLQANLGVYFVMALTAAGSNVHTWYSSAYRFTSIDGANMRADSAKARTELRRELEQREANYEKRLALMEQSLELRNPEIDKDIAEVKEDIEAMLAAIQAMQKTLIRIEQHRHPDIGGT